ncbi:MAG: hypothetical protein U9R53_06185, partial [Chloroflexota bacterium]|nr:hypothetical protein [Chloroflexota bacterium]
PQQWIAAAEIAEDIAAPPSATDFWDQGESSSEEEDDPQGGSDVNIYKPLRFKNNGAYDVTVLPASYTPDSSVVAVGMSNASTVVFRDSSPTAYLDLPMGTYTFCYYWDLGTDIDNDGYVDYAHKNTGSVTLSEASPAKVISAQVVTLNPGNMNNPNGKCGENVTPPSGNALSLTTAELSNQGQHTYSVSGYYGEETFEPEIESYSFKFTVDGVCVIDEDGEDCLGKTAPNVYSDNDDTITFTESGWVSEGYLEFYDGVSYPYKFTGTLIQ